MNYIGIDSGLDGAMCIIFENGNIQLIDTPTLEIKSGKKKRREYNVNFMWGSFKGIEFMKYQFDGLHWSIALEKVHSMPGQGVRSMFSMGMGYGIWLGLIAATNTPLTLVTPQAWKKEMMQGMGKEKDGTEIMKGTGAMVIYTCDNYK